MFINLIMAGFDNWIKGVRMYVCVYIYIHTHTHTHTTNQGIMDITIVGSTSATGI
jgi:hypothetical protein